MDYSKMSDEELQALIDGKETAPVAEVVKRGFKKDAGQHGPAAPTTAEEIEPSALKRGIAAVGGVMQEPVLGAAEKLELMFPGKGNEEATRARIGADRSERRRHLQALEATPAGQFGSLVGMGAMTLPFGPAAAPQMAGMGGLGFLGGGPDKPAGAWNEMISSGFRGATDAAATGLAVKGMEGLGRSVNAARGRYTPRGEEALALDAAASRLGVTPKLTVGQLDPTSPSGVVERNLPGYGQRVQQQADSLQGSLDGVRTVPDPAGGTAQQVVPGGKLAEAAQEAIKARQFQAKQMYSEVDQFAQANGLSPIDPNYTINTLGALNKQLTPAGKSPTGNNLAFNLLDHYDPDAFTWLKKAGSPKAARTNGVSMAEYHDARVAVGKAISSLDRVPPANRTADQMDAYKGLLDLKTALDSDVERWAKQNAKNTEALGLYNRAKDFYSTTVADATMNPLARKFMSKSRGFQSPEEMYNAVLNPNNATHVDRMLPTASSEGTDLISTFRGLPDVGRTVARREAPEARGAKGALTALGAAMGHPVSALAEVAPGLRWLSSQRPAKRVYFAANPMEGAGGKGLAAAAQWPATEIEDWAQGRTGTRRP